MTKIDKIFIASVASLLLIGSIYIFGIVYYIDYQNKTSDKAVATPIKKAYKKYKLVDINIYTRNITDRFGRIINTKDYIRYAFIDSKGNIIHKDRIYDGNQKNVYRLHKSKNDISYLIDKSNYNNASLDFYLTENMYNNLYK